MAAQQPQKAEGIEELIDPKTIQKQVKLISTVKGAIELMKKDNSNLSFNIIHTQGSIVAASRKDVATVIFEDAKGFVDYITNLHCYEASGHPLLVLRGKITIPATYDLGGSSYSPGFQGESFDDGLAYLEHLPKVQAYFIPRKQ